MSLRLFNVGIVIGNSWCEAEKNLQDIVKSKIPDADEDEITNRFQEALADDLNSRSARSSIALAFERDLEVAFSNILDNINIKELSSGIVAQVIRDPMQVEGRTGGDIGIVISRPNITISGDSAILLESRSGILCQAKLRGRTGEWGALTDAQVRNLCTKMDYSSLLLYEYSDPMRTTLRNFMWQLCRGYNIDNVIEWLRKSSFPDKGGAIDIINLLAVGNIGTSNPEHIDKFVSPKGCRSINVRIWWSDKRKPGSQISVKTTKTHVQIKVQRSN